MVKTTQDGSPTLFSERFQQTYHSIHGSITESNHIFLSETGVKNRLQAGLPTRILEVGLGTGLNFLLTAQLALTSNTLLEYWAFEHTIISKATFLALGLEKFIKNGILLERFADTFESLSTAPSNKTHSFILFEGVSLHVLKGDATEMPLPNIQCDAVYQDAFSPDVNPELWSTAFFQRIYDTMHSNARLTTFSVRRLVRDNLTAVGFTIQKRPGPTGGKREMLLAIKKDHEQSIPK